MGHYLLAQEMLFYLVEEHPGEAAMQGQHEKTTGEEGLLTEAVVSPNAEIVRQREELLLCRIRAVARTIDDRVRHLLNSEQGGAFPGLDKFSGPHSLFSAGEFR
jgi:hypothetical protein